MIGQQWKLPDPTDLLTPDTFDVPAKTTYARAYLQKWETDWPVRLYIQHLAVWNGLDEPDTPRKKIGASCFIRVFNDILEDMRAGRFDFSKSPILVNAKGKCVDGRHRLAAAIALKLPVEVQEAGAQVGQEVADYWYFRDMKHHHPEGLTTKWADAMTIEYCRLKPKVQVTAIPARPRKEVLSVMKKFGTPIYERQVTLDNDGQLNLIMELDGGRDRPDEIETRHLGAEAKARHFLTKHREIGVYVLELSSSYDAEILKSDLRGSCGIENDSVHITNTKGEALRACRALLNDNGLHFLNTARPVLFPNYQAVLREYRNFVVSQSEKDEAAWGNENFAVDGDAVLAAYGLRDVTGLDFVSRKNAEARSSLIHNNNDQLFYHGVTVDELLYNPENHFWVSGIKFIALPAIRRMKCKRGRERDREDIKMIDSLRNLSHETLHGEPVSGRTSR